ncbi:hypothetical protein [Thermocrinis sp.]|uniref:hypothetical protein n=1 Tax=Thermocrinis sp. TaxID=2024383 RepID=UPI003C06F230
MIWCLVLCLVFGVGAMCKQRLGVWCGVGAVPSKQARQWFGAWCYARIRCKVKVLGAKVWCFVRCCAVGRCCVGAVWVQNKQAKVWCYAGAVWVYISSKCLVWWGAGF